jgi:hypothetical protein
MAIKVAVQKKNTTPSNITWDKYNHSIPDMLVSYSEYAGLKVSSIMVSRNTDGNKSVTLHPYPMDKNATYYIIKTFGGNRYSLKCNGAANVSRRFNRSCFGKKSKTEMLDKSNMLSPDSIGHDDLTKYIASTWLPDEVFTKGTVEDMLEDCLNINVPDCHVFAVHESRGGSVESLTYMSSFLWTEVDVTPVNRFGMVIRSNVLVDDKVSVSPSFTMCRHVDTLPSILVNFLENHFAPTIPEKYYEKPRSVSTPPCLITDFNTPLECSPLSTPDYVGEKISTADASCSPLDMTAFSVRPIIDPTSGDDNICVTRCKLEYGMYSPQALDVDITSNRVIFGSKDEPASKAVADYMEMGHNIHCRSCQHKVITDAGNFTCVLATTGGDCDSSHGGLNLPKKKFIVCPVGMFMEYDTFSKTAGALMSNPVY